MIRTGAVAERQLVGREHERRTLRVALAAAVCGPRALALVGEPGIGKSVLLEELRRLAEAKGRCVASGTATALDREVPLQLWVEALGDMPGAHRLPHATARRRLELLALAGPLVVLLDDVQWADPASVELLAALLREPPDAPVLLAFAYRPAHAPDVLRAAMQSVRPHGPLVVLEPSPLGNAEAAELLGAGVPASRRQALVAHSGGNPFYLVELARAAGTPGSGGLRGEAVRGDPVLPAPVAVAIQAELARLSRDARRVAEAAAALADRIDVELLQAVADLDRARIDAALVELEAGGLVRRDSAALRFRQPVVRQAVYESAAGAVRVDAHARAAAALTERAAPLAERAHHLALSAAPGDAAAIAALIAAGHADARRAPAAAVRWFRTALNLVDPGDGHLRSSVLPALASALAATGQLEDGRAVLAEALELMPREASRARARVIGQAAGIDSSRGDADGAAALIEEGLASLEPGDEVGRCMLLVESSMQRWLTFDWSSMAREAELALAAARAVAEQGLELESLALSALGQYYCADVERARERLVEAEAILAEGDDGMHAASAWVALLLGLTHFGLERYADAEAMLLRGLAIVRASGQELWLAQLTTALALSELRTGRLERARARLEPVIVSAAAADYQTGLMWTRSAHAWASALLGDVGDAVAVAEAARDALARAPSSGMSWLPSAVLGAALIETGAPERAVAAIVGQAGGAGLERIEPGFRVHWYEQLVQAELARGDVAAARSWLMRAEGMVPAVPLPGRFAACELARARVLLAEGSAAAAAAAATVAVAAFEDAGQPVDAGRAWVVAGQALAAAERPADARAALERARALLADCGARLLLQRAETALQAIAASTVDLTTLSRREREVAALVADGLSNRAIAAELVLSERTVERHVSRIFGKLEIRSRAALAALVARGAVD